MTATIANYLSDLDFFKELPREYIEFLGSKAEWQRYAEDKVLFRIGDSASSFYVVGKGAIQLEVPAISGPTLEVEHLGPDQVLGWSWLIPPYRWNFNARTEAESELLMVEGSPVLERCERDAEFGYQLLKRFSALMSERLNVARQKMIDQWNPPGFA